MQGDIDRCGGTQGARVGNPAFLTFRGRRHCGEEAEERRGQEGLTLRQWGGAASRGRSVGQETILPGDRRLG